LIIRKLQYTNKDSSFTPELDLAILGGFAPGIISVCIEIMPQILTEPSIKTLEKMLQIY
jgi:hypothetical protein